MNRSYWRGSGHPEALRRTFIEFVVELQAHKNVCGDTATTMILFLKLKNCIFSCFPLAVPLVITLSFLVRADIFLTDF